MLFLSPLDQFEILVFHPFFIFNSIDLSITNVTIYGFLVVVYFLSLYYFSFYRAKIIPNRWQYFIESLYNFVLDTLKQQVGTKGQLYFPVLFLVFIFILFANLVGMTPFGYTLTSHIIITFMIGFSIFFGIVLIGVIRLKKHFIDLFIPGQGLPKLLVPMIIIIEVLSYLIRPFSISIRLFANIMAGHTLLTILAQFTYILFNTKIWMGVLPFLVILAVTCLELFIACLQAYVFIVLLAIYFNDSLSGASH
jgi:F-type H+-transporting ATPase subunit a